MINFSIGRYINFRHRVKLQVSVQCSIFDRCTWTQILTETFTTTRGINISIFQGVKQWHKARKMQWKGLYLKVFRNCHLGFKPFIKKSTCTLFGKDSFRCLDENSKFPSHVTKVFYDKYLTPIVNFVHESIVSTSHPLQTKDYSSLLYNLTWAKIYIL